MITRDEFKTIAGNGIWKQNTSIVQILGLCPLLAVTTNAVNGIMLSLATIWLKTSLMPRWLVYGTYAGAVVLLVASDVSMWLVLVFPAWVLVVSMLALVKAGVIHLHHDDPEPHNNSA